MAELVRYASLEEAVEALMTDSERLDDPVTSFLDEINTQIGPDGKAWSGTAAEEVVPLLRDLQTSIGMIQKACSDYSKRVGKSLAGYQATDARSVNDIYDKVG
jgi:hypothetical protein